MRASVACLDFASAMKAVFLVFALLAATRCGPGHARTPAEAHARLLSAVATHDSTRLWNALDQDTQWSWMSTQRAWRECYDITQSAVPEGTERARLLARFEPGATAENAKALFAAMLSPDDWKLAETLVAAAGAAQPQLDPSGESARIDTPKGSLVYRKAHNRYWGWGFAGFADRAEQLKRTASADLDRMRTDAADYERAATRGAR
jgi:hypothetical protein